MPFTFSHPAAILPLKRCCPTWLNFPALVFGSMASDVPYFFLRTNLAHHAHTLHGSITIGLPIGLVLLTAFYLLRKPLCHLLPMPHRAALQPKTETWPALGIFPLLAIIISLLIGVWTHNFWDAFTHDGGYFVQRSSLLRHPIIQHDKMTLHAYTILQHTSTLIGLGLIIFLYWRWLNSQPKPSPIPGQTDQWRYILVGGLALAGLVLGIPIAAILASRFNGYGAIKIFLVREAVCAVTFFISTVTLAAIIIHFRNKNSEQGV